MKKRGDKARSASIFLGFVAASLATFIYLSGCSNPAAPQAVATPTFSPTPGSFSSAQTVTISTATSGATIYYTTDTSSPSTSSTVYKGALTVSNTETIKAIAVESGMADSTVATASYIIVGGGTGGTSGSVAAPSFSLAGGTYTSDQTTTITESTSGATVYYTTDGSTPTTSSTVYTAGSQLALNGPTLRETIKAIAVASGASSSVASASYVIDTPYGWVGPPTGLGSYGWTSVMMSQDGSHMAVGSNDATTSQLYTSVNYGKNWSALSATSPPAHYNALAGSDDLSTLITGIAAPNKYFYTYTYAPSGGAWSQSNGVANSEIAVGSSSTGQYLVEAQCGILDVSNAYGSGSSWNSTFSSFTSGTPCGEAVAVAPNGQHMALATADSDIWTSSDYGATWTDQTNSGTANGGNGWFSVAMSSDGSHLVAASMNTQGIYTSSDSGVHWALASGTSGNDWTWVASSSDGSILAAADSASGYVYISTDYGATWKQQTTPRTSSQWGSIAMSADGTYIAVADTQGQKVWVGKKQP